MGKTLSMSNDLLQLSLEEKFVVVSLVTCIGRVMANIGGPLPARLQTALCSVSGSDGSGSSIVTKLTVTEHA